LAEETKYCILIVDDEPANLDLLRGILHEKFKVKAAINGVQALKIALKDPAPDLILLDIVMPEMDGFSVLAHLRDDSRAENIPVIFISANADSEQKQKGIELGATGFLSKPINPQMLYSLIEEILNISI